MVDDFLITLLWMVVNLSLIVTRALHVRGISGKVTFPGITSSIGHKYGTHFGPIKKPHLCGQFSTKRSPSVSGKPASHRRSFPSNACFVYLTLDNPLNTNFGIVFKLEGRDGGLLALCTNFVGCGPEIMILLLENKRCLGSVS